MSWSTGIRAGWATASAIVSALANLLRSGGRMPQAAELKVGDAAPAFELAGSDGRTHRLADYKGKTVVVAWFPKAFTGG
jgi:peroxiredoxin Q/BCP